VLHSYCSISSSGLDDSRVINPVSRHRDLFKVSQKATQETLSVPAIMVLIQKDFAATFRTARMFKLHVFHFVPSTDKFLALIFE